MAIYCLVAHEAEYMRHLITNILDKNGFEVVGSASTGEEAVAMYRELRPDVLTMDINMPELDGLAALQQIIDFDPHARVIMCASMGERTMVNELLTAGAKDILVKPFLELPVIDTIKKAISSGA